MDGDIRPDRLCRPRNKQRAGGNSRVQHFNQRDALNSAVDGSLLGQERYRGVCLGGFAMGFIFATRWVGQQRHCGREHQVRTSLR